MDLSKLTSAVQTHPDIINWFVFNTQGQFIKGQPEFDECQSLSVFTPLNMDEYNAKIEAEKQNEAIEAFKQQRQSLLDNAIVKISTGKSFDADELSINRMVSAILAAHFQDDSFIIKWSTADTGTGELVDCTLAELKEAQKLAMENMASIWSRE